MIVTRPCPGCRRDTLRPVEGGLGKMGRCPSCGWTGPLRGGERARWTTIPDWGEPQPDEDYDEIWRLIS